MNSQVQKEKNKKKKENLQMNRNYQIYNLKMQIIKLPN